MEPIIAPVSKEIIKSELTPAKKLRDTNKGHNEIYIVNHFDSPNTMREIGRLREEAFRDSGGGSGLSMDIDEFDTMEHPYQQLIVWDPDAEKIIGGYRYLLGTDIKLDKNGQPVLATAHMFHFSDKFIKEYLPFTIELGRSFIAPEYQSRQAGMKALFALDNLWDGLGALIVKYTNMKYFFGKMTMYPEYNRQARDLIQYFLFKHFEDKEKLVVPMEPLKIETPVEYMQSLLTEDEFKEDYKLLNAEVRKRGVNIPPLVNSYMNLSPTMKMFGGGVNHEFSEAEETCILITFDEIYDDKVSRHIDSFLKEKAGYIQSRFPQFFDNMGETLTEMLANLEGMERGPAGNTALAAAFSLAQELPEDEYIICSETEYTGAGKHIQPQLAFARENGIEIKFGDPATEDKPGVNIILPKDPSFIKTKDMDIVHMRESFIKKACKKYGSFDIDDDDIQFLAEETNSTPEFVKSTIEKLQK
jgi:hypothetical protein